MSLDLTGIVNLEDDTASEQEISDDSQEIKLQKLQAEIDALKATTENTRNNIKLKKELADKTFTFMVCVTGVVGYVLFAYVFHFIYTNTAIPENFMIALVTTTFATVVGLVGFILKGLFGSKES